MIEDLEALRGAIAPRRSYRHRWGRSPNIGRCCPQKRRVLDHQHASPWNQEPPETFRSSRCFSIGAGVRQRSDRNGQVHAPSEVELITNYQSRCQPRGSSSSTTDVGLAAALWESLRYHGIISPAYIVLTLSVPHRDACYLQLRRLPFALPATGRPVRRRIPRGGPRDIHSSRRQMYLGHSSAASR